MFICFVDTFCLYSDLTGKKLKAFRFNPELCERFKECASTSGYTVTSVLKGL